MVFIFCQLLKVLVFPNSITINQKTIMGERKMGRLKKEIRYEQRYKKIWYYKIREQGWKSSGTATKSKAVKIAEKELNSEEKPVAGKLSFKEYSKEFFIPNKCPRSLRLEIEGRKPTDRYLQIQRINLEKHIFSSSFSNKQIDNIKRADVLDFRKDLNSKKLKPATINKILSAVKTIFREAELREDITHNPTDGIGNVKDSVSSKDILTNEELSTLFDKNNYVQIWKDIMSYTCFLLALNTGMRRGEILALKWKHIEFEKSYIVIEEAWKDVTTIGKPKSGKTRYTPISKTIIEILLEYKEKKKFSTKDNDLIFSYSDGSRLGETWWKKKFDTALEKAKIKTENRHLTPHTLRHTINTKLRDSGENPDKIRAALGWSSEAIQNRYTHWKPEHFNELGKSIENVLDGLF